MHKALFVDKQVPGVLHHHGLAVESLGRVRQGLGALVGDGEGPGFGDGRAERGQNLLQGQTLLGVEPA